MQASGQEVGGSPLERSVLDFLQRSSSAGDIGNLLDILGKDRERFPSLFDSVPSINPLNPDRMGRFSSSFGERFHPVDGKYKKHLGIDISANAGTPVHAIAAGKVTVARHSSKGYGNLVAIGHAYGFSSRYAHLYTFIVREGQTIKKGEIIGFVGSTGKSTGNHVHFELWKGKVAVDPYPFFSLEL